MYVCWSEAYYFDNHTHVRPTSAVLSDKGAKVSEAYGSALDIPFLGRFSNRQTYIISPVRWPRCVVTGRVEVHAGLT